MASNASAAVLPPLLRSSTLAHASSHLALLNTKPLAHFVTPRIASFASYLGVPLPTAAASLGGAGGLGGWMLWLPPPLLLLNAWRVSHGTRQVSATYHDGQADADLTSAAATKSNSMPHHDARLSLVSSAILNLVLLFGGLTLVYSLFLGLPNPILTSPYVVLVFTAVHVLSTVSGLGGWALRCQRRSEGVSLIVDLVIAAVDAVCRTEGIVLLGVEAVRSHPVPAIAQSPFAAILVGTLMGGLTPLLIPLFHLTTPDWRLGTPSWIKSPSELLQVDVSSSLLVSLLYASLTQPGATCGALHAARPVWSTAAAGLARLGAPEVWTSYASHSVDVVARRWLALQHDVVDAASAAASAKPGVGRVVDVGGRELASLLASCGGASSTRGAGATATATAARPLLPSQEAYVASCALLLVCLVSARLRRALRTLPYPDHGKKASPSKRQARRVGGGVVSPPKVGAAAAAAAPTRAKKPLPSPPTPPPPPPPSLLAHAKFAGAEAAASAAGDTSEKTTTTTKTTAAAGKRNKKKQ